MEQRFRAEIGRQAANQHVQGTAADMTKKSAIDIRNCIIKQRHDARLVGLVHYEVIVEVENSEVEVVSKMVIEKMEAAQLFFCPTVEPKVDGVSSPHWLK